MSKNFGIKVSQDGKDVSNNQEEDMVLDSNRNLFKIVRTGVVRTSGGVLTAGNAVVEPAVVDYGELELSDPPLIIARGNISGTTSFFPWSGTVLESYLPDNAAALDIYRVVLFHTYTTNRQTRFEATFINSSGSSWTYSAYNIRYYILQETSN